MKKSTFQKKYSVENTHTHSLTRVNTCVYKQRTKSRKAYTILLMVITSGRLDKKEILSLFTLYTSVIV